MALPTKMDNGQHVQGDLLRVLRRVVITHCQVVVVHRQSNSTNIQQIPNKELPIAIQKSYQINLLGQCIQLVTFIFPLLIVGSVKDRQQEAEQHLRFLTLLCCYVLQSII